MNTLATIPATLAISAMLIPTAVAQITLRPGTLLATDRGSNSLRHFDATTGDQIASLSLPPIPGRTLEGVALVGTTAAVAYASSTTPSLRQIVLINLATGAQLAAAAAANPVGLAAANGEFLAVNAVNSTQFSVQRFSPSGSLLGTRSLFTFNTLGLNEAIDDIAWDGTRYVTVSNFRLPGVGAFELYQWNPTTGQPENGARTLRYPTLGLFAEGFDLAPDGTHWFTYNAAPGSTAATLIERYDPTTGARQTFAPSGVGALSDVAYVSIPTPASAGLLAFAALSLATRRSRPSAHRNVGSQDLNP